MPNWSRNTLKVSADYRADVFSFIKSQESLFDFNKIIPMPEELDLPDSSLGGVGEAALYGVDIEEVLERVQFKKAGIVTREQLLAHLESNEELTYTADDHPANEMFGIKAGEILPVIRNADKIEALELGERYYLNRLKYGAKTWFYWRAQNWGTKWNASEVELSEHHETGEPVIWFETAWAPPMPIIEKLSREFPEAVIRIDFSIEGSFVYGHYTFQGGEVIEQESKEWEWEEEPGESIDLPFD